MVILQICIAKGLEGLFVQQMFLQMTLIDDKMLAGINLEATLSALFFDYATAETGRSGKLLLYSQ